MQSAVHAHGCAKAARRGVLKVGPEQLPFSVQRELKKSTNEYYYLLILMLRVYTALHRLYKFDLSMVTWETGDGLEVRASGDEFLAKNQPNRLRNNEMGNLAPESQLTALICQLTSNTNPKEERYPNI